MLEHYRTLADLLIEVEKELRLMRLWEMQSPSPEALTSVEPFAVDMLLFNQWLQFVFLPRMGALVESEAPLPDNCSVVPMAEEFFKGQKVEAAAIISRLAAIDRLITNL
ncbi:YqcC family protein [Porticoccaceae bacterium]|nr:YqcC family protein [Porticoccaceae bacterium]